MGVLANVFGGSTGQFGTGPTAVTAQGLTSEGFDLTKPFIQDVLEAGRAQFFEDTTDPETGDTIQQLAPFEQFTGPRLADFSSEQQEAFTGLAALGRQGLATTPDLSSSAPYFQQAKQQAGLGSLAFTEADADRLMNPFLRGVTDTAKREAIREYEGTIQPKLDAAAVQAGSFGGSRAAILEAEAQRNLQQQLSEIEERGLATAFEQAQRGFESERGRQLQSSALFSGLGEAAPAQAARELALLSSTGEAKQAQEQAALNLAEKDFIEQREFPLRQLQEYQSLVRGFPFTPSTYQVTSQSQPQPSFGQQLLGTLGTGAGIFGALGGFSNKAGGQVVPRQSGGQVRGGLAGLERHQNNDILRQRPRLPDGSFYPARGAIGRGAANPMGGGDRRSFIDVITSIFNRPPNVQQANMASIKANQPRFSGQQASDLPPVVRVGEAAPGSLRETSALIEALQPTQLRPRRAGLDTYMDIVNNKPTGEYTSPVTVSLDENYNVVKPRGISASEAYNPGRMDPTGMKGEYRIPQSIVDDYMSSIEADKLLRRATRMGSGPSRTNILEPMQDIEGGLAEEVEIKKKKIESDDPASRSYSKAEVKLDMEKMEADALKAQAKEEAVKAEAAKAGGGSAPVLNSNEQKRLGDGSPELSKVYSELDTAFSDYLSFLEKKKGEGAERLSEAEEARESRLFAELAATSARFAGQAGPGGFLAKLNQAALPSIAELKNIQGDFRKESRAAKDIEGDILKDKLNINLAKTKLDMKRSELESQNLLRAAKAQAERIANRYGLDANEAYDKLVKSINDLTIAPFQKVQVYNRFTNLLNEGTNPTSAVNTANAFALSLGKGSARSSGTTETRTTQAALNDVQRAAKDKLAAANKLSK